MTKSLLRKGNAPLLFKVMRKAAEYEPKPYTQMKYSGENVQVDTKFVPLSCTEAIGDGVRFYQFTAIEEYSRKRYIEGYPDKSSYSAAQFIQKAAKYFVSLLNVYKLTTNRNLQSHLVLGAKKAKNINLHYSK